MDHTIGKLVVPIRTGKSSGKPSARAIHSPTIAPTKPSAIDTRQPPRENPVIACPSAPQIPATISKMSKSNNVIVRIITRISRYPPLVANGLHVAASQQHPLTSVICRSHSDQMGTTASPNCAVMPRLICLSHMRQSLRQLLIVLLAEVAIPTYVQLFAAAGS
jgi:hypothetical protein